MPNRCVVWGCSNTPNPKEGIFLFTVPFFGDDRPEAKGRRRNWVKFIATKRKNFNPSKGSSVCSDHFKPEDFSIRFTQLIPGQKPLIARLLRDEVGVCVCPSIIQATKTIKTAMKEYESQRLDASTSSANSLEHSTPEVDIHVQQLEDHDQVQQTIEESSEILEQHEVPDSTPTSHNQPQSQEQILTSSCTRKCKNCARLKREKRLWRQRWRKQKELVSEKRNELENMDGTAKHI